MNQSVITVVGSINIDFSVRAAKLPAPGESVVGDEFLRAFGGKGANQAVGIARLTDQPVRFIGAVGNDSLGKEGTESLDKNRINTQFIRVVDGVSTGVALIMLDQRGENCIVAAPGANAFVDPAYIRTLPEEIFQSTCLFVVCQEIPIESIEIVIQRAKKYEVPVLFNPAPPNPRSKDSDVLSQVDYLTPNQTEASEITGVEVARMASESGQLEAMRRLRDSGARSIAITLGEQGCLVFDDRSMEKVNESIRIETPNVTPVDTTAAGDSFNAALAVALCEGQPFAKACEWANQVAAVTVTRRGAQDSLPLREELPAV